MILKDQDSRDSDIDLGDDLTDDGWGTCSYLDAESEEETAGQEESMDVEVSDNRIDATLTSSSGYNTDLLACLVMNCNRNMMI